MSRTPPPGGFNKPLGGNDSPRFAGPMTFMRLPAAPTAEGLDAAILGVPMDIGTSFRSGARHGPQAVRAESRMIRPYNMATGAAPFDRLQIADLGDVATNPYDLKDSVRRIEAFHAEVRAAGAVPVSIGGDHTMTLPCLRAAAGRHGPVAMIHVDAHADVNEAMMGEAIAHGTPFRRAVEEGLLIQDRVWQIGLRGSGYGPDDFGWCRDQGFHVVQAEDCWHRSLTPLMAEVRDSVGDAPVYLTFDIDSLDPAFAPGTGTQEVGGLTSPQALEIVRGCAGLALIGCDLVEVAPPWDTSGATAMLGANLVYEMLCVLP
ncbi:MAG: agmatinase [Pseudomonadota bacterium]